MLRRFSINFAIFSILLDFLLVLLMLYVSTIVRPCLNSLDFVENIAGPIALPPVLYLLFPIAWVAVLASFAIYDGRRFMRVVDEFTALTLASLLAGVTLAGILYLSFRDISRVQYLLFVGLTYIALLTWRIVARAIFRLVRERTTESVRRVLIVGTGPLGRMVAERLSGGADVGVSLVGYVDDEVAEGFQGKLLGKTAELVNTVDHTNTTDVIVALPPHFYEQIRFAVSCLSEKAVRVWIALGFYDLALYRTVTEDLAGIPLLDLRASALNEYERMVKRAFDLVVGAMALVLASPLLLIAAVLVVLQDGTPVLFRQSRVGENGRLFKILKFRTMVKNAEQLRNDVKARDDLGQLVHKIRNDPRVTPVGRVLRRLSIDELPQLINVLRGDMSLVGPRPELPDLVEHYEPWQRQRLVVPPGITGWWQVTGRSDKTMHLHTEDDMYYVRNYSIWLDLQIIVRTLWVVLLGKGAY